MDWILIRLTFPRTLRDRIELIGMPWDFGHIDVIHYFMSTFSILMFQIPQSSYDICFIYWGYKQNALLPFPFLKRKCHVRQIPLDSRKSSAQVPLIGTLLRVYYSMAASEPTTQLSLKTHFLCQLRNRFEAFRVHLGCFLLDRWHLSATVGLIIWSKSYVLWSRPPHPSELVRCW